MSETVNSRYTIVDCEGFLSTRIGFFDVCRYEDNPHGVQFLQKEAWKAREIVLNSTERAIKRVHSI